MPRPPAQPRRSDVSPDEIEAYDHIAERLLKAGFASHGGDDAVLDPYWGAISNTPTFGRVLRDMATLIRTNAERPGAYSYADYEWVDNVLSFELSYYGFLTTHIPDGVGSGIRIEAIEALANGRDEELTDDELLMATFIRQVCHGKLTDDIYEAVERRLGTRGVVEYAILTAYLQLVIRMWQALQIPSPSREEIDRLILDIKEGRYDVATWKSHMV